MNRNVDGIDRSVAAIGKRVAHWDDRDDLIGVKACSTVRFAPCPACHSWSNQIHGSYIRHLAERPSIERPVVLAVQIHRFRCPNLDARDAHFPKTSTLCLDGINDARTLTPGHFGRLDMP